MGIREYIENSIKLDKRRIDHYRKTNNNIKLNGILIRKPNKGSQSARYYYRPKGGREKYLGKKDRNTIIALQQKRLAKEMMERDMEKEMVYNINGIYQPHNYMVTADGPNNTMDMESTKLIIQGWLLPKLSI